MNKFITVLIVVIYICLFLPSVSFSAEEKNEDEIVGNFAEHFIIKEDALEEISFQRLEQAYSHWSEVYGFTLDRPVNVYVYNRVLTARELNHAAGRYVIFDKYVPSLDDEVLLADDIYSRDIDVQVGQIFMADRRWYVDKAASNTLAPWRDNKEVVEFAWWERGLLYFLKGVDFYLPTYRTIYLKSRIGSMSSAVRNRVLNRDALVKEARFPAHYVTKNAIDEAFWAYLYSTLDSNTFYAIVRGVTLENKSLGSTLKAVDGSSLSEVWSDFKNTFPERDEEAEKAEKFIMGSRFEQILDFSVSTTGTYIAILKRNIPGREALTIRELNNNTFRHSIHRRKFTGYSWSTGYDKIYYQNLSSRNIKQSHVYDAEDNKTDKSDDLSLINDFSMGFNDVAFGVDSEMNLCVLKSEQRTITCLTEDKPPNLLFFRPKSSPAQSVFIFATSQDGRLTNYVLDPNTEAYAQIFGGLDLVVDPDWTPSGECVYFMGYKNDNMDLYRFCVDEMVVEKSDKYFGNIDFPHTNLEGDMLFFVRHRSNQDLIEKYPLAEIAWIPISDQSTLSSRRYSSAAVYRSEKSSLKTFLRWTSPYSIFPYVEPVPYGAKVGVGTDITFKEFGHIHGYVAWDSKINNIDIRMMMERERRFWSPRFEYALENTYVRATNSFWRRHLFDFGISWLPHPRTKLTFGGRLERIFFKNFSLLPSDNFSGPYIKFDLSTKPDYFSLTPLPGLRWLTDAYMALDWNGSKRHPVIKSDFNYTVNPAGLIYDFGVHLRYTTNINPNYRFFSFGGDLGYLSKRPFPGVIGLPYQQFLGQHVISINQEFWLPVASINRGITSDYLNLGDVYLVGLFDIGWPDFTNGSNHYKSVGGELRLMTKIAPYLPLRLAAGYHHNFDGFGGTLYWAVRSQF